MDALQVLESVGPHLLRPLARAVRRWAQRPRPVRTRCCPVAVECLEERLGPTNLSALEGLAVLPARDEVRPVEFIVPETRDPVVAEPKGAPVSPAFQISAVGVEGVLPSPAEPSGLGHEPPPRNGRPERISDQWQLLDTAFSLPGLFSPPRRDPATTVSTRNSSQAPPSQGAFASAGAIDENVATPSPRPGTAGSPSSGLPGSLAATLRSLFSRGGPRPNASPAPMTTGPVAPPGPSGEAGGSAFPGEAPPPTTGAPGDSNAGGGTVVVVVVVSPAGPASPAAAAVNAPSPANGNAQPGPSHIPVVTPTVTSLLGSVDASSPVPPGDAFRVQRAPAPGPQLEVYYTLRSYEGTETVLRTGTLSFPDDAGHVDLPADGAAGSRGTPEILVLTLRPDQGYRVGKRSVTMFRGAGPACADEGVLLKAYQEAQSEEAFRALVERHRSTVYQTCRQLLGNSHDAEDVTQLVFLALAQRQVFLQTTLVRWLRKVARNAALMLLRSRGRRARHERKAARVDAAVADSHELTEELNAALALMSAPLREAVRLRYLEDRSQNEAADIAGCPRGTLSQRAAKGVRSLRDILLGRGTVV